MEAIQSVINEAAKRRSVAAYINELSSIESQQVKFRMPQTLEEMVQVAVMVSSGQRRAPDTESMFSAKSDNSSHGVYFYCAKKRLLSWSQEWAAAGHASPNPPTGRNSNARKIRCFHCKKLGRRRDVPQCMIPQHPHLTARRPGTQNRPRNLK